MAEIITTNERSCPRKVRVRLPERTVDVDLPGISNAEQQQANAHTILLAEILEALAWLPRQLGAK